MRTRGTILIVFVLLIVAAFFAWKMFNPGPTAFVQGSTVALADYHAGDPTGVPADLKNADVVRRGEYLARAADCRACHTVSRDQLYAGGHRPTCRPSSRRRRRVRRRREMRRPRRSANACSKARACIVMTGPA
jgi:hypothetical protein